MQMNGIMGESSAELLGSHKAVTKGGSAATTLPSLKKGKEPVTLIANGVTSVSANTNYKLTSSADHIFVNGVAVSSGYSLTLVLGEKVQIITQNGLEAPFITVLSCK